MAENEEYLEHHGILGMKWGVRRSDAQLGYKKSDSTYVKGLKKNIKAEGLISGVLDTKVTGTNKGKSKTNIKYKQAVNRQKLSEKKDDIKSLNAGVDPKKRSDNESKLYDAVALRIGGTSSRGRGPASTLSNDELKSAVERMSMEKRYRELQADDAQAHMSKGQRFMNTAGEVLGQSIKTASQQYLTKQIGNMLNGGASDSQSNGNSNNNARTTAQSMADDFVKGNKSDVSTAKEFGQILKKADNNYGAYQSKMGEKIDDYNNTPANKTTAYKTGQIIKRGTDKLANYKSNMNTSMNSNELDGYKAKHLKK